MSKKQILFVIHQLNTGGVQKALLSALNAIDYQEYDVTLYVRKDRLDLLSGVNKNVREVIINDDHRHLYRRPRSVFLIGQGKLYSLLGKKGKAKKAAQKLSEYIAEQRLAYEKKRFFSNGKAFDVAIAYIQGYPAKLVADCVDAKRKIMFFHGSTDENHTLHEAIFDRLDVIVGVNAGVQKVLEGLYPSWKNKMTFLTNYVDADDIREKSLKTTIQVPHGRTVLCSCGRLSSVKGFDLAIQAAKLLKDREIKFLWYFVGDGPERGNLEAMIREMGLEDCIAITGMQANPYPWMKACDIYVQPSYEEAHPLSIIEAQILCKPVVSTSTVGGQVLIKDHETGVLTKIDAVSLALGIEALLDDLPLRQHIQTAMSAIDYAKKEKEFKENWAKLLGDE